MNISNKASEPQNFSTGTQLPTIIVDGNAVESVDNFVYLGSVFTFDCYRYCCPDINRRISRSSSAMPSLQHIWKNQRLSLTTKTLIYHALAVRIIIRSWNLVYSLYQFQSPRGLSFEVSKATNANQMAQIHPEWRHLCNHWSPIHLWYHQSPTQRSLWPRSQTARWRSSLQGTQLSHQPITRSTTKQSVATSPRPSPVTDGSISSRQITTFHLLQTSGGVLSTVVTEGRRYSSCRLSDNNNNNNSSIMISSLGQTNF